MLQKKIGFKKMLWLKKLGKEGFWQFAIGLLVIGGISYGVIDDEQGKKLVDGIIELLPILVPIVGGNLAMLGIRNGAKHGVEVKKKDEKK